MRIEVSAQDVLVVRFWTTVRFPWVRVTILTDWMSRTTSAITLSGAVIGQNVDPLGGARNRGIDPFGR